MLPGIGLPTTASQNLTSGFDLEEPLFILSGIAQAEAARPEIRPDCLQIAVFENSMRNKRPGFESASDALKKRRN